MAHDPDPNQPLAGEEAIVALLEPLTAGAPGAFGLKDDCALLAPEPGSELVLKTDPIAEGIHFLPGDPPQDIGWKALAVNVSDLVAKGAAPLGYLMALSFPAAPTLGWMTAFAEGLRAAQTRFGCHLLGGDTDRRPGPVTISITAIGSVPRGRMVQRTTAQAGDAVFVSGTVGDARLGLELLKNPALQAAWGLPDAEAALLHQRYRRPEVRLGLAAALRQYASAAMDLSDGLVKDFDRLLRASGKAGSLAAGNVPLSEPARKVLARDPARNLDGLARLITAGDDYEVLATVPKAKARLFAGAASAAGVPVTEIGAILPGPPALAVTGPGGAPLHLPDRTGWDHF